MSPVRFERQLVDDEVTTTIIKTSKKSFELQPNEATALLGVTKSTLFRHDGPDVRFLQRRRKGQNPVSERRYNDATLLRIASETGISQIRSEKHGDRTELSSYGVNAILDINWENEGKYIAAGEEVPEPVRFYHQVGLLTDGRRFGTHRNSYGSMSYEIVPKGIRARARVGTTKPLSPDDPRFSNSPIRPLEEK